MSYVPAPMPELLVVGSSNLLDYFSDGVTTYYIPTMVYNPSQDRCEGYYLQVPSISYQAPIQGYAINITPDVICTVTCTWSGLIQLGLNSISDMKSTGAAFDGPTDFNSANKNLAYASNTLTATNNDHAQTASRHFIIPYTNEHFIVAIAGEVWLVSVEDCSVVNSFVVDTDNSNYSRFTEFADNYPSVSSPVVMADGTLAMFVRQARNAANTSNVTISAVVKVDLTTGTTVASNYNFSNNKNTIVAMPDNTLYVQESSSVCHRLSEDFSTITAITGFGGGTQAFSAVDSQDAWWNFGRNPSSGDYFPMLLTVSGTTGTATAKTSSPATAVTFTASYDYLTVSVFDSDTIFVRSAVGSGTGASIQSYVGVYNKSDGLAAAGYTHQQMIDYYSGNAISGTGFNNSNFARSNCRDFPDPTLYTVREVLQLMGTTPGAGIQCKVYNGSTWDAAVRKVYNGSTWDTATPKVYDGSAWQG